MPSNDRRNNELCYAPIYRTLLEDVMKLLRLTANLSIIVIYLSCLSGCGLFTPQGTVESPVVTPPAGSYSQDQMVSIACTTEGAEIRYTLDGSIPPTNSLVYVSPFMVQRGTELKVIASKPGWKSSNVISAFYSGITPSPVIMLESGTYDAGTVASIMVDSDNLNPNHMKIRYTLDGSEPDSTSTIYNNTQGVVLTTSCTLKAKGFYQNWIPSPSSIAQYTIITHEVAAPVITPASGTVEILTNVIISCATQNATIHYTSNGDDPTENSPVYNNPLTIVLGGSIVIKAKAYKQFMEPSQITTVQYNVTVPMVATPSIQPASGNVVIGTQVTITCQTPETSIHYTTNGQEPNENSSTYHNPLTIITGGVVIIKAKAFKQYMSPSPTATTQYSVTIPTVATPVVTPTSGNVDIGTVITITCSTPGSIIRYTTDGTNPTENSQVYNNSLTIVQGGNLDLRVKAFKTYWNPSQQVNLMYYVVVPTVAMPIITPSSGYIDLGDTVTITCSTTGATIRYTLNGNEPNEGSIEYYNPIPLTELGSHTIKAKAYKPYWTPSQTNTAIIGVTVEPPTMVFVQGGTFNNGTSNVTLSSFYIGKYEIQQSQFYSAMGWESSYFNNETYPVEQVSWFYAVEFCNWLSIQEGFSPCYSYSSYGTNPDNWPSGWWSSNANHMNISCNWNSNGYRLPTEMEWMFAAMGGNQTHNYTYSGSNDVNSVAWYGQNSNSTTHAVGLKNANEVVTYDMSGNVSEWCWDIYNEEYPSGNQTNPHGVSSGSERVRRGGAWNNWHGSCRVYERISNYPSTSSNSIGFRIARKAN